MNSCMHSIILKLLKQARLANKYNQADVGKAIGVKGNTIGNYENGVTEPDIDTFIRLCKFYGIDYIAILEAAYGHVDEVHFNENELRIIKKYRQLDADGREDVNDYVDMKLAQIQRKSEDAGELLG